ncbi:MAG: hypothetical protein SCALA702_06070 [Melioribacteraceae bacterium]|nr:MAG: hypothetical protein SCALA702_06070 [Melioribacteraceae bacterium]
MIKSRKLLIGIFLFLSFNVSFYSRNGLDPNKDLSQYLIKSWQTDHGLPQNSVREIIQTQDGYLWFATEEGLARFDGVSFKVFNKINTDILQENFINDIYEDSQNRLWIATNGGGVVYYSKGTFYTPYSDTKLSFAKCIIEDKKGNIYIGTDLNGIAILGDDKVNRFLTGSDGLPSNTIHEMACDNAGKIWIASESGLSTYNGSVTSPNIPEISGMEFFSVLASPDGIYAGTKNNGYFRIRNNSIVEHVTSDDGLSSDEVKYFFYDSFRTLWVGTSDGLNRVVNGKIKILDESDGLPVKSVYTILEDFEKNLWVGTAGGGVTKIRDGKFTTYSQNEGLNYDIIWTIFERSNGDIWIGTDGGGVNIIKKDGSVEILNSASGLPNDVIFAFEEDREGNMWVGTYGSGLVKISNGKISVLSENDGLLSDVIRSIDMDNFGNLWVGTTKGLNIVTNGKVSDITYTTSNGLASSYVRDVLHDSRGNAWVGTRGGGISQISNGRVINTFTESEGISNNTVRVISEDKKGNIWAGTSAGLNLIQNGNVSPFTVRDGLFDDPVFALVDDNYGNFWISCNKGVYSVKIADLLSYSKGEELIETVAYGKKDGMKSSECNGTGSPAGILASTGNIWFPTIKGVVTINPAKITSNDYIPPVIIEQVVVDNYNIKLSEELVVEAGQEKFEFHYTALSYSSPEHVKFKYMLEGLDDDWVDAGTRRVAYYNNIPPGSYEFKVIACNNDGIWNEAGSSLQFEFEAFFYQTVWFYLLLAAFVISGSVYFFRRRVKLMEAREQELKKHLEAAEENKKLAEKNEEKAHNMMAEMEKAKKMIEDEKHYLAERSAYMLENINLLAKGDLTVELKNELNDDIGKLFAGFNDAISRIKEVFDDLVITIENTNNSGKKIQDEAEGVHRGVENQSMQLNEVMSSIEQMNKTINDTARNIEVVSLSSEKAGQDALEGEKVVKSVIDKMQIIESSVTNSNSLVHTLGESSEKIGDIISVINDIADQTNLLALNAAIEAARAGEHGRGFAIVADEVRKLSEKTTIATNDISKMIKQIQKDTSTVINSIEEEKEEVESGIKLVSKAGEVLTRINENSGELNSVIVQVATASEEQAAASTQIVMSVESINNINKEFEQAVRQILDSVEDLTRKTSQLENKAGYFNTKRLSGQNGDLYLN